VPERQLVSVRLPFDSPFIAQHVSLQTWNPAGHGPGELDVYA
jgi:hypothetical protein